MLTHHFCVFAQLCLRPMRTALKYTWITLENKLSIKMNQSFGVSSMQIWGLVLNATQCLTCTGIPGGSCNSGRFRGSWLQLHILAKLLLLDSAKGLCQLWCRYMQHSQPLRFKLELLSTWGTSFVWHESWRVLETVAGWDSEGNTPSLHRDHHCALDIVAHASWSHAMVRK